MIIMVAKEKGYLEKGGKKFRGKEAAGMVDTDKKSRLREGSLDCAGGIG